MSAEELLASLDFLPPEERAVLLLCALPGRTYRAVADVLGVEATVVLARLRSGLQRMADGVSWTSPQEVARDVLPQAHGQLQRLEVDPLVLAVEP